MNNQEALNTLKDIREMKAKSTRFLSLSGWSSVIIGIYSCIAAMIAQYVLAQTGIDKTGILFLFAITLIALSLLTTILMCRHKAQRQHRQLQLDLPTRRLLWNFFLPLLVGGILCLSLIWQQHYGLTSSLMLIFYGIALISASHYTYSNTRYLGYAEIILGLIDSFMVNHALLFWMIGFGIFHIIYGIFFCLKYEK